MVELLKPIFDRLFSLYGDRRHIRLTVHKACFRGSTRACYFINATNLSRNREVEITHVWFDVKPQVAALQASRPLPKRLKPDETWETWIEVAELPYGLAEGAFTLARARLSTGTIIKSKRNNDVPEQGPVPGGPL